MADGKKRIGVLTCGGDCPGLNAVIRAVLSTAAIYGFQTIGIHDGFEGLINEKYTELDRSDVSDLLSVGGTVLGTTNRGHFTVPLKDIIKKKVLDTYNKLHLECIICIGGEGTMTIAHQISLLGINVIGVPKTIDNDLMSTDQTFGFDSAISVITEALDRLNTTAASHHRVMVVEVMGRNAGWIALYSGVAGGASVILLPEIDWQWEPVFEKIRERVKIHRYHYCIVVVAEGAKMPGVGVIAAEVDSSQQVRRLGGIGQKVADKIAAATGLETRATVLGYVQRGGSPTCLDRILATKFGSMAARLACEGKYGSMVSLSGAQITTIPITSALSQQKLINVDEDQLMWAARATGVEFGDEWIKNFTHK